MEARGLMKPSDLFSLKFFYKLPMIKRRIEIIKISDYHNTASKPTLALVFDKYFTMHHI